MKSRRVVWTLKAVNSLNEFCDFIAKDSETAWQKVRNEIIRTAGSLSTNPEVYQVDEHYNGRSQNIRRFFRWSYKVVYQILDKEIVILDVFHTKMNKE